MRKVALFLILFLFQGISLLAQQTSAYQKLVATAGLFHLQKNYKQAILYYEKAFDLEQPDELSAYKAAGAYALDANAPNIRSL